MNITVLEKKIVVFLLSHTLDNTTIKERIICHFYSGRDIRLEPERMSLYPFDSEKATVLDIFASLIRYEAGQDIRKILLQYASEDKIYSDVEFEINPDGSYTSRYWFDEERLYKEEYDYAMLGAKDFPHAAATNLVNYHFFEIKFKRKFTRIHWTMEVKNGESFFDIYSINKKNQRLPVELQEIGVMFNVEDQMVYFEKFWKYSLLKHYETTNNGILKDVWKPWNKIILSIPPNGYLDENEDIAYYLDDVKLEKDFFLRGY